MFQIKVRSVSSARRLRNQRSMSAFIRGAFTALRITLMPASVRTWSKAAQNEASRSWIGNLARMPVSSRSMTRFRGLLYDPVRHGVRGGAEHTYAPAGVFDHCQDVDLGAVEQVDHDEVGGQDRLGLGAQELRPARAGVPAWGWVDARGGEDFPDGRGRHTDTQCGQLAVDAPVAPGAVFPRQAQYQGFDAMVGWRASRASAP